MFSTGPGTQNGPGQEDFVTWSGGFNKGGGVCVQSGLPHLCRDQNLDLVQACPAAFVFPEGSLKRAHGVGMVFGLFWASQSPT